MSRKEQELFVGLMTVASDVAQYELGKEINENVFEVRRRFPEDSPSGDLTSFSIVDLGDVTKFKLLKIVVEDGGDHIIVGKIPRAVAAILDVL